MVVSARHWQSYMWDWLGDRFTEYSKADRKKLPTYRDREDPFIFSGIEDLGAMLDNTLIPKTEFTILT